MPKPYPQEFRDDVVAVAREANRGDRRKGPMNLDHPLLQTVQDHGCYDLRLDTSEMTPRDVAGRIVSVLADPPQPSAFERLRRRTQLRA